MTHRLFTYPFIVCCIGLLGACSKEDEPSNIEPRLLIAEATDITRNEATLHGQVVVEGAADIPTLSFHYGPTADMTIDGGNVVAAGDGQASLSLTGLTAGTTYYYRLQATNGRVTLRSPQASFTTLHNDRPTVGKPALQCQGPSSLIVAYEIEADGGEPITATGCRIAPLGSDDYATFEASLPASPTANAIRLTIDGLAQHTTYTLYAYATNKEGTSLGDPLQATLGDAVVVNEPGRLADLLGSSLYQIESLTLDGPLNGDDLLTLRRMAGRAPDGSTTTGRLTTIDMTDAELVEGGASYDGEHFAKADVIGSGLFADCQNLTSVVLPKSTTTVEKDAFRGCTSLSSLTIPAVATSVTPSDGCTSLAKLLVSAANDQFKSIDGVLFNAEATAIVWFPLGKRGDYVLPESVTSIGDYAFQGCRIAHFTLPEGLTAMGQAVFYGSEIEEITMPGQLKTIPTATFQCCAKLTTVHLGAATELVSDYVFDGCRLTDLYVEATYPPVCNAKAFASTDGADPIAGCTLHVAKGRKTIYRNHKTWGKFTKIIEE